MSAQTDLRDAKAFADAYKPSESDHPDMHSRVVMFRRAVESEKGTKRTTRQAAHARALVRFVRQTGGTIPKAPAAKKSAAKKPGGNGGGGS
jgi:hypothetical protein